MAVIASAQTGLWSATTTWTGGVVPGNGDTVTIGPHTVTVDDDRIVGTSPIENSGTYAIDFTANLGKLIIDGAKLTVRGDIKMRDNTVLREQLVIQSKTTSAGKLEFDASQAASPSTTNYRLLTSNALSSQYTKIRIIGNATYRAELLSNAGGGNAFITRAGFIETGFIEADYGLFTRIGDATNPFYDFNLQNLSVAIMSFTDCIWDACGEITGVTTPNAAAVIKFVRCLWKNTAHATRCCNLPQGPSSSSLGLFTDCDPDKDVQLSTPSNWKLDGTHFYGGLTIAGTVAWNSAIGVLLRKTVAGTPTQVAGDVTDWYVLLDFSAGNPHGIGPRGNLAMTAIGVIFDYLGAQADGDLFNIGASGVAGRAIVIKNSIVCVNTGGGQPGKLISVLGINNVVTAEHNTINSDGSGTQLESGVFAFGETYLGADGMLASCKSNLSIGTVANGAVIITRNSSSTVQFTNAGIATHNAKYRPRTASTDGDGYHAYGASPPTIFSAGSPGSNDVAVLSEPCVDRLRKITTWDTSLGGPGTAANALAELRKRNDVSGFNPLYTREALIAYIRGGFAPTDQALKNAGHDGVTIGAVEMAAAGASILRPPYLRRGSSHGAR